MAKILVDFVLDDQIMKASTGSDIGIEPFPGKTLGETLWQISAQDTDGIVAAHGGDASAALHSYNTLDYLAEGAAMTAMAYGANQMGTAPFGQPLTPGGTNTSSITSGSSGQVVYPRGQGAATGPVPKGYVSVSRWVDSAEADAWIANGGTTIPGGIGGQSGRVYVTTPGSPRPGGTGPIRVDFSVRADSLNVAGRPEWYQIMQPTSNMPIYNVAIHYPGP
jgi:filamentous hemagglutinin